MSPMTDSSFDFNRRESPMSKFYVDTRMDSSPSNGKGNHVIGDRFIPRRNDGVRDLSNYHHLGMEPQQLVIDAETSPAKQVNLFCRCISFLHGL